SMRRQRRWCPVLSTWFKRMCVIRRSLKKLCSRCKPKEPPITNPAFTLPSTSCL
ncbi:hypothetical protein M9458_044472, partial [Cirrhinus mrigala]